MSYLLAQIFICLLIAFLIGLIIGWWIGRRNCAARVSELEAEVADLNAALTKCEAARSAAGASASAAKSATGAASGAALAAAAMPVAAAIPTEPDDLKKVWGIGPKMEEVLNGAGIDTFAELSRTSVERLREIVAAYGSKRLTDIANEEVWMVTALA